MSAITITVEQKTTRLDGASTSTRACIRVPTGPQPPAPSNAFIRCKCGHVTVEFTAKKAKVALECCCVDCFAKNEYYAGLGGPQLPPRFANRELPLVLNYWDNCLKVTGKDKLAFTKIREGCASTNAIASCCNTVMFIDHPAYAGNGVMTFNTIVPAQNAEECKARLRVYTADYPADRLAKLPELPNAWKDPATGAFTGTGDWPTEFGAWAETMKGMSSSDGESFSDLMAAAGGFTVLGLPEGDESCTKQYTASA